MTTDPAAVLRANQALEAIRESAGRLFDEAFAAIGWSEEDYGVWAIRQAVVAIAAGGEAAAMRQVLDHHTFTLPQVDPATGRIRDPLLERCMAVIRQARAAGDAIRNNGQENTHV